MDSHGRFICPSDVTPLFRDNSYKKVHDDVYENVFWWHLEYLIAGLLHQSTEFRMEKCSPWRCTNRKYVCIKRHLKVIKAFPSPKYFQIIWNWYQVRSTIFQSNVILTHVNPNISNAKQKNRDMICSYISFIFCPCLAFWIVPVWISSPLASLLKY